MCFFLPQVIDIKALEAMNAERIAILNRELLQLKEKMVRGRPCYMLLRRLCALFQVFCGSRRAFGETSSTRLAADSSALKKTNSRTFFLLGPLLRCKG